MKVKIVRCVGNMAWYIDKIGEVYSVVESESLAFKNHYKVDGDGIAHYIDKHDCEIVGTNKYSREIKPGVYVDVYDVLRAFNVTDPCLQHLLKKALAAGCRGHKDTKEDLQDILASAKRAVEMYNEWGNTENETTTT